MRSGDERARQLEPRFDLQLVHALNHTAKVVAEYVARQFVHLGTIPLPTRIMLSLAPVASAPRAYLLVTRLRWHRECALRLCTYMPLIATPVCVTNAGVRGQAQPGATGRNAHARCSPPRAPWCLPVASAAS